MEKNRRIIILAVMLMLTVVNFGRMVGSESIRTVEFLSIFVMGALSSLLIHELIIKFKQADN
jgi:hypothetical protein